MHAALAHRKFSGHWKQALQRKRKVHWSLGGTASWLVAGRFVAWTANQRPQDAQAASEAQGIPEIQEIQARLAMREGQEAWAGRAGHAVRNRCLQAARP
jgi:hypothetical protein